MHDTSAPPQMVVMGMWHAQIVSAVAQLGVADRLANGPASGEELARECGANPDALSRTAGNVSLVVATPGLFSIIEAVKVS